MTTVRRITVSQIDGNDANTNDTNEIRPFGEAAFYLDTNSNPAKPTLLMFDGTRTHLKSKVLSLGVLFGSNADAGDGSNADTIKLIPDADLFANGSNQYLIVDPTGGEPGHIHIRAGGTQDASSADLYLGGELTCVRVSDTSNFVTVRTTNIGDPNITMDWTFNTDGNLYFPGLGNNRIGESEPGLVVSSSDAVVLQSNNNGESNEWLFNTNGNITFPDTTVQTTAWAGGRVVSVPASSIGATGNKQGDIAFNGSYIYYCTQNFVEASYSSTIVITYSGTFPTIVKGSIPQPQSGWVFIHNGNTYTLDSNATESNPGEWVCSLSSSISVNAGDSVTVGPASAQHIWKRVAWSVDTW